MTCFCGPPLSSSHHLAGEGTLYFLGKADTSLLASGQDLSTQNLNLLEISLLSQIHKYWINYYIYVIIYVISWIMSSMSVTDLCWSFTFTIYICQRTKLRYDMKVIAFSRQMFSTLLLVLGNAVHQTIYFPYEIAFLKHLLPESLSGTCKDGWIFDR